MLGCVLIILIISSCSVSQDIPFEMDDEIRVYFCPRDECEQHFIDFINSSKFSLHCALFDLKLEKVINAFAEKSREIDVRIVIDNENNKKQIDGIGVKWDTTSQLSHNKFCIKDDKMVWTGSFNPTERGAYHNNNNIIIFSSKSLAQNYEEEFNELWNKEFGKGERVKAPIINYNGIKIENYFCPEDCISQPSFTNTKGWALYKIIDLLRNAEESIYFMTFSFTHEDIADAILFNDKAEIKGVFEKTQAGSKYSQYHRLKGFGLDVKKDSNPANMHHKVFIIDRKTVITGSWNPSKSGTTKNDENILIIHDRNIATKYLEEFTRIWNDIS